MNKLSKEQIIAKAKEDGFFINTDNIRYDLDGKGMAEYLQSIGFNIVSYKDVGTHGLVVTSDGIKVSTNGYCYKYNEVK